MALILAVAAFWQSGRPTQASHLPTLDVAHIRWLQEGGSLRNQIWAGSVNFGDEVILAEPGEWPKCRTEINSGYMLGICSDLAPSPWGTASVVTLQGHRGGTESKSNPIVYILEPGANPGDPGSLRTAIYYNQVCFAPQGSGQHPNRLDTCVERVGGQYTPDLKFTAGGKYVLLSELTALLGR